MTLTDLKNRFRLMVAEATGINDTDLLSLLNDGALDIARRTECLLSYADQDVNDAQQEYDLPTDCIKVLSVYYGGTGEWEKLPEVTTEYLANELGVDWLNDTGETTAYYKRANKIGLYKIPTSAEAGTSFLRIYHIEKPDALSTGSDVPLNGQTQLYPYHELLVIYAMYQAKKVMGKWEQAKVIEAEYLGKCMEAKIELQKLDDFMQPITPYYKGSSSISLKQNPLDQ